MKRRRIVTIASASAATTALLFAFSSGPALADADPTDSSAHYQSKVNTKSGKFEQVTDSVHVHDGEASVHG